MDTFDNPDHGVQHFNGVTMVDHSFKPDVSIDTPAPEGGPVFPATSDVEVSGVPT